MNFNTKSYPLDWIAGIEWDNIQETLKSGGDITKRCYASYDDWEDDCGHSEIDEAQYQLETILNDYFEFKKLPYSAVRWIEEVKIQKVFPNE